MYLAEYYSQNKTKIREAQHIKYHTDENFRRECLEREAQKLNDPELRRRMSEYKKEWHRRNPEKYRIWSIKQRQKWRDGKVDKVAKNAYTQRWRARNPDKVKQYAESYRETRRETAKLWGKNNRDKKRVHLVNYRARKKAVGGSVTTKQWKEIVLFYGRACAICKTPEARRPLTIDHFIPIIKGGDNSPSNVWPLCLHCNCTKAQKLPSDPFPPHVAIFEQKETA